MAIRVANSSDNLSSATAWDTVRNVPSIHATTNVAVNTTARFTATFTAPNTTNACTGVVFAISSAPTAANWTVTLQQNTIDTAAVGTVTASTQVTGNWVYVRFATPFVYTTTTAGAYRFKVVASASAGSIAGDSGGLLYSFMATDNVLGVPGSTDDLWILAHNTTTPITTTVTGSNTVGSGSSDTVAVAVQRAYNNAINIGGGGSSTGLAVLKWDTTASATISCKGSIVVNPGGELQMGTAVANQPTGTIARLAMTMNTASTDFGIRIYPGGRCQLYGEPKSSTALWKTKYASGSGIAADPLITADAVDWAVGDEIYIAPTSNNATNYSEGEKRFIITKNSTTSYVLSATSGGAEIALTNVHTTDAWILNVQRNVVIDTTDITKSYYFWNGSTVTGDVAGKWLRCETTGSATSSKNGFYLTTAAGVTSQFDYCVNYRPLYYGFIHSTSKAKLTNTGLISCWSTSASTTPGISLSSAANSKSLVDCFVVSSTRFGFNIASYNLSLTRCYAIACNTSGGLTTTATGGFVFTSAGGVTMTDCEAHCNRNQGLTLNGQATSSVVRGLFGTKGTNSIDVNCIVDTASDIVFLSSTFASATLVNNYLGLLPGSTVRFQTKNLTANNNFYYTPVGSATATGGGLTDTFVRTAGSLAFRMAPEDNVTGFEWDEYVPVDAHNTASFQAYFGANTALATDVAASARVDLYLPGSATPDATTTIPLTEVTGGAVWPSVTVTAQYTGNSPGLATVKVYVFTVTAGAYLYVDDTFNAGNTVVSKDPVTGLDVWVNGLLSPVLQPSVASQGYIAGAVWSANTSDYVSTGTMGKKQKDAMTKTDFEARR